MSKNPERQPGDKKSFSRFGYLPDPSVVRPHEKIGAGYFVMMRDASSGRVCAPLHPFEHPNLGSAVAEVERLAKQRPGHRFEILKAHTAK